MHARNVRAPLSTALLLVLAACSSNPDIGAAARPPTAAAKAVATPAAEPGRETVKSRPRYAMNRLREQLVTSP